MVKKVVQSARASRVVRKAQGTVGWEFTPTYSPAYAPLKHGVTQSILTEWFKCDVRAFLRLSGYKPIGHISDALVFGTIMHTCLAYYRKAMQAKRLIAVDQIWGIVNLASMEFQKLNPMHPIQSETHEILLVKAAAALRGYVRTYQREDMVTKIMYIEEPFDIETPAFPFLGKGIRLRGIKDAGVMLKQGKKERLWIVESKTRSSINALTMDLIAFDFQSLFYMVASQRTSTKVGITDLHPAGVVYDIIRTPGLRLGKNERLSDYAKRLDGDVDKKQDTYFQRFSAAFPQKLVDRFQERLYEDIIPSFLRWFCGEGPCIQRTTQCGYPSACPYISFCASHGKDTSSLTLGHAPLEELGGIQ